MPMSYAFWFWWYWHGWFEATCGKCRQGAVLARFGGASDQWYYTTRCPECGYEADELDGSPL